MPMMVLGVRMRGSIAYGGSLGIGRGRWGVGGWTVEEWGDDRVGGMVGVWVVWGGGGVGGVGGVGGRGGGGCGKVG